MTKVKLYRQEGKKMTMQQARADMAWVTMIRKIHKKIGLEYNSMINNVEGAGYLYPKHRNRRK